MSPLSASEAPMSEMNRLRPKPEGASLDPSGNSRSAWPAKAAEPWSSPRLRQ